MSMMVPSTVNFNNLTMKDLLNEDDVENLRELWPYLKCTCCNVLMIEPKMCISCNKNLCINCQKKNCNHETIISRHLKSILQNTQFKCKFFGNGCNDETFYDYFKLKTHCENCSAFKNTYVYKSTYNMENKSNSNSNSQVDPLTSVLNNYDNKINSTIYTPNLAISYKPITIQNTDFNNKDKYTFSCSCGETFVGNSKIKEDYLNHKRQCLQKKEYEFNQKEEDNVGLKEKLVSDFMVKIEKLQKTFAESSKQKHNEYLSKVQFELAQFHDDLRKKDETMKNYQEEIANYYVQTNINKSFIPDEVLSSNPDYTGLIEEEKNLKKEKNELQNSLIISTQDFKEKKLQSEKELKELALDYKSKLLQYEIEESWLKETISQYNPGIISSVFSDTDTCSACKNVNVNVKKYYCQECRKRFCAGTCAKLCSTSSCSKISKYICPECVPKCGLCRKNVFCYDCKKPCFYKECKNMFCPDCFKKNAHQIRNHNNNCVFFTCPNDNVKSCLMTSLHCAKCDQRLCNNCLFNDKAHFDFLFK